MGYDSNTNVSIPISASNAKELNKKKRVNRTAKLKQSKLDVRREQWLSQMKNKGCKVEVIGASGVKMPNDVGRVMKLEINHECEENEGLMNHQSDSESPSNSPTSSHTSSVFGSHFTSNSSRSSSSSSSGGGCCSKSMTEENECFDDWEAIADALAADDIINSNNLDPNRDHKPAPQSPEPEPVSATKFGQDDGCARAWRADDVFRPQSLPNLIKQNTFPMNSGRCYGGLPPSTCPICCEDLDLTDTSFLPCSCGYRLCLFCHKRILEDDGRCPGCRKQYDHHGQGNASIKLARSYSTIPRH